MSLQNFRPNIPSDLNDPRFAYQVAESIRLLFEGLEKTKLDVKSETEKQVSQQITQQIVQNITQQIIENPTIPPTQPQGSQNPNLQSLTSDQSKPNITGLLGFTAQNQLAYVPTFRTATPDKSSPLIQQGSIFYNSLNSHLYYCTETDPVTFVDLGNLGGIRYGTYASIGTASTYTNTLYFATDRQWVYYSNGTNWLYATGLASGTRSTRTGLTITTSDNNALFYETDTCQTWRISAGAWVLNSFGAISSGRAGTAQNGNVTTDQTLFTFTLTTDILNSVNRVIRFTFSGLYSMVAPTAPNITWKVKYGSTTLLSWTPATPNVTTTNLPFRIVGEITTDTTGASGKVEAHGFCIVENSMAAGHDTKSQLDSNTAVVSSIDLTSDQVLTLTIAFDQASTSNSGIIRQSLVEVLC